MPESFPHFETRAPYTAALAVGALLLTSAAQCDETASAARHRSVTINCVGHNGETLTRSEAPTSGHAIDFKAITPDTRNEGAQLVSVWRSPKQGIMYAGASDWIPLTHKIGPKRVPETGFSHTLYPPKKGGRKVLLKVHCGTNYSKKPD